MKLNYSLKYMLLYTVIMLYNNDTFETYCIDNNIELLDDFSKIKITRDTNINGKYVTKEFNNICSKIFNKNFRQLVKTGPYCYNCSVENGKKKSKKKPNKPRKNVKHDSVEEIIWILNI